MIPEQVPQRIKFQWWRDIPRNVSRHEYERHQLIIFGAVASGFFAFGSLAMAVTGVTMKTSEELAELPAMTVAEAANSNANYDLVKISGYLVGNGDDALTMPDDDTAKVLRGRLQLIVEDASIAEDVNLSETLWEWSEGVDQGVASQVELGLIVTRVGLRFGLRLFFVVGLAFALSLGAPFRLKFD